MNDFQRRNVEGWIVEFGKTIVIGVHGDALGADAEFHAILRSKCPHVQIEIRPGISAQDGSTIRAYTQADKEYASRTYGERNRDIVDQCDFMLGTPLNEQKRRSGTWRTLKYAHRCGKPGLIVLPGRCVDLQTFFSDT